MARSPQPPTWEEIRALIERADEVCRESELLRVQAARQRHKPAFWPERRQPARKHDRQVGSERDEGGSTPEGSEGTL